MSENNKKTNTKDWVDYLFKGLAIFVIPILMWCISIHTEKALLVQKVESLEKRIHNIKIVNDSVNLNKNSLISLGEKLQALKGTMDDIKGLIKQQNTRWENFILDNNRSDNRSRPRK